MEILSSAPETMGAPPCPFGRRAALARLLVLTDDGLAALLARMTEERELGIQERRLDGARPQIGTRNPMTSRQRNIVQNAVNIMHERIQDYSDCAKVFGGEGNFLDAVNKATIDISSSDDPRYDLAYLIGMSNDNFAFTLTGTTHVLLNDHPIPVQGVPGFFNVSTGAKAAIIGHELLHVMGIRHPGSNDFSGAQAMENIVTNCHLDNPSNSENWVP